MPRLLIIDDDDAVRESLVEALTLSRFEVIEAASGRQGLSILASERIDGVFLDLRMPEMDGLEVLKRAKQLPLRPPVVVLTPFVALNCAAIPAELMESELFGHLKGAFTGAISDRAGAFLDANGGILFLDEVGDMPPAMQAKMLRVLQESVITPIGGKPREVDVRIIAATHRNLAQWVEAGRLREDLLYRLNMVPIHLPPLRERPEDIAQLARRFLGEAQSECKTFAESAETLLQRHRWPGNVRELRNAVIRAAALSKTAIIGADDFAFLESHSPTLQAEPPVGDLPGAIEQLEAAMIGKALKAAQGNRAEAARLLNIPRQQLYVKLKKYGL